MKIYIVLMIFVCLSGKIVAQQNIPVCYKNVKPVEFKSILDKNKVIIIDVRVLKEYEKKRIENAYLASDSKILKAICTEFDKADTILIYCDKGDRSEKAAQIICTEYKFLNVYNLKGGILSWEKEGLPVDNSKIDYEND